MATEIQRCYACGRFMVETSDGLWECPHCGDVADLRYDDDLIDVEIAYYDALYDGPVRDQELRIEADKRLSDLIDYQHEAFGLPGDDQ